MQQELARHAIKAALNNNWSEAIEINLQILEDDPSDTEALNRIAQAYIKTGSVSKAHETAKHVIEIDPLNLIAKRCMDRCHALDGKNVDQINSASRIQQIFIEEPGKTKIVSLINICEPSLIATLTPGEEVRLLPKTHKIIVTTLSDSYIGRLPDDTAHRMIYLFKIGNQYLSHMKSASVEGIRLFIREVYKSERFANEHSFPNYR